MSTNISNSDDLIDSREVIKRIFEVMPEGDFRYEQAETTDWMPYYCDDCDTYHLAGYLLELERKDGKRSVAVLEGDQDGNWDIDIAWKEGEDAAWMMDHPAFDPESYTQAWQKYYKHVAATGEDPLHEFNVMREYKKERTWIVQVVPSILMEKFGAPIVRARPLRGAYTTDIPQGVLDFMMAEKHGNIHYCTAIRTLEDMKEYTYTRGGRNLIKATYTETIQRNPATIKKELIEAARKAIKE